MLETFQVIALKCGLLFDLFFLMIMTEFNGDDCTNKVPRSDNSNPIKRGQLGVKESPKLRSLRLYSLCVWGKLAKNVLRRAASHSMLSWRLARAFRSLTSRRISFWGINLSPRFPVSTSDSLAKATLSTVEKKGELEYIVCFIHTKQCKQRKRELHHHPPDK